MFHFSYETCHGKRERRRFSLRRKTFPGIPNDTLCYKRLFPQPPDGCDQRIHFSTKSKQQPEFKKERKGDSKLSSPADVEKVTQERGGWGAVNRESRRRIKGGHIYCVLIFVLTFTKLFPSGATLRNINAM